MLLYPEIFEIIVGKLNLPNQLYIAGVCLSWRKFICRLHKQNKVVLSKTIINLRSHDGSAHSKDKFYIVTSNTVLTYDALTLKLKDDSIHFNTNHRQISGYDYGIIAYYNKKLFVYNQQLEYQYTLCNRYIKNISCICGSQNVLLTLHDNRNKIHVHKIHNDGRFNNVGEFNDDKTINLNDKPLRGIHLLDNEHCFYNTQNNIIIFNYVESTFKIINYPTTINLQSVPSPLINVIDKIFLVIFSGSIYEQPLQIDFYISNNIKSDNVTWSKIDIISPQNHRIISSHFIINKIILLFTQRESSYIKIYDIDTQQLVEIDHLNMRIVQSYVIKTTLFLVLFKDGYSVRVYDMKYHF